MRKLLFLIVAALFLSSAAFGHEDVGDPDEIMREMMAQQGVSVAGQLDCGKISDTDFEALGDAVMERMAGGHEVHEQMDTMMGGEGSASLRSVHTAMGSNWLGCHSASAGAMGPMMMRMMGSYYPAFYSGYDLVLALAVIGWLLFAVAMYFLLTRKKHRR